MKKTKKKKILPTEVIIQAELREYTDGIYYWLVIFPDNTRKPFSFSDFDARARRCSVRDYIECEIQSFYEQYYNYLPKLLIQFS